MHLPFIQRPRLLQFLGQLCTASEHARPTEPPAHSHLREIGLHAPLGPQGGTQAPSSMAHEGPEKPGAQRHVPLLHVPCPEQPGSGHISFIEQSLPSHPVSQTQLPGLSQLPWPLQHPTVEQSVPKKPAKHKHAPSMQWPLCEHSFGQKLHVVPL